MSALQLKILANKQSRMRMLFKYANNNHRMPFNTLNFNQNAEVLTSLEANNRMEVLFLTV